MIRDALGHCMPHPLCVQAVSRSASGTSSSPEQHRGKSGQRSMKPLHSQTLLTTNVKTMCIAPFSECRV